ncbi:short-chain dehydrogenase [Mycena pura]|uniref:Short-chain dehydrogenase n=1 Tax=Mycena pura TaxID=153505 RepID=A0AAD6VGJ7_9AGAR|nr:short-chain dehydrogenase [Mycena pura]
MGKFGPPSKWLKDQWEKIPLKTRDLKGRTVLVVGGNTGLGFEASKHLAAMKPQKLIVTSRSPKGQAAVDSIKLATGCETVELGVVDLTHFGSIINFVNELKGKGINRLDCVLMNAGMMTPKFQLTKDGWETTLQTNYLGTALLTLRLIPFLTETPHEDPFPRLVFVGSEVHYFVSRMKEEDILSSLNDRKKAEMSSRYYVTKTLNLFFARSLAEKIPPHKMTVTSINPGFCRSGLIRNSGIFKMVGLKIATALLSRSTEMGARCIIHGMLIAKDEDVEGKYLNNCRVEEESDFVISENGAKIQQRAWRELCEVLFKVDPEAQAVVDQYLVSD